MNRCFKQPYTGNQGALAQAILNSLNSRMHEAVVDAHNTSAHSVPFVVSVRDSGNIRLLSTLFADNLVIMDQTLGTLIDHGDHTNPWITMEFGGLMDPRADQLAYESLGVFISQPRLFDRPTEPANILHHPLRLEISADARIHYSSSVIHNSHITMFNTIDQLNFQMVPADTPLGWVSPEGLSRFNVRSNQGDESIHDYFYDNNGFFTTTQSLTLFMATTDPYIAVKDCLLYLTPRRHH